MNPSRWIAAAAMAAGTLTPWCAQAQVAVRADVNVSLPVGAPQQDEFGAGGGAGLAVEWAPWTRLGFLARVQGLGLSAGAGASLPEGVAHPGVGTLAGLTVGARLRPLAWWLAPQGDGPWIELAGGAGITGSDVRPLFTARGGFGFSLGPVGVDPYVGYAHVFDVGTSVLPGDAHVISLGVEIAHVFVHPAPAHVAVAIAASSPPPPTCPPVEHPIAGDADHDGCPDNDHDQDGIADPDDRCPNDPEDHDGFDDTDGCPDPDNDHDGIPDTVDRCPNEPETVNGVDDEDGCPDSAPVEVVHGRIQTTSVIEFGFNSARILPASYELLHSVARLLQAHAEYATVYIEGHSDEIGDDNYNYNLSFQRARSVVAMLVQFGIVRERLVPMGFGRSAPLVRLHSNAARARNRRVEFVVDGHRSTGRARVARGYVNVRDDGSAAP